jgi:hypothetical protein
MPFVKARPPNFHLHSIEIWRIMSGNEVAKRPPVARFARGGPSGWAFLL